MKVMGKPTWDLEFMLQQEHMFLKISLRLKTFSEKPLEENAMMV